MPGSSDTASPDQGAAAAPGGPTKAALVVAAYDFEDAKFRELRSPARDVAALAAVLNDPDVGGFQVKTVLNESSALVQQEIERFFSARKPDDLLLLYFSCHGVKDGTGRLYFATTNTTFDLLRSTGIAASFVSEQMELTRSKRIVLLLDCCYSGAFIKGFRARGDDSVSVSQLEGRGRAVITASRATEYAFEADELTTANAQPSVFTGAIVEGLATGAADRDGDGSVTVDELYDYVYDQVRGKVAGQTPGRWVNIEGELVIARNPRPPVRPAELPAEVVKAIESEVALYRLGAVLQLKQWLEDGDPGRELTARRVLETLAADYDQRVRTAAEAVLAGETTSTPVAATDATPTVVTATSPEAEPEAPTPKPEPTPEPTTVPALERPAGTERSGTSTERAVGWLMLGGFVAMVTALFVPFVTYDQYGYSERLSDDAWNDLLVLGFGALAGYAALCLIGQGLSSDNGLAIALGMLPAVTWIGLYGATRLAEIDGPRIAAGVILLEAGCVAFVAAGALTLALARGHFTLTWTREQRPVAIAAAATVVGIAAAAAWGAIYEIESEPMWSLILRLAVLTTLLCIFSDWLQRHGIRGPVRIGSTAVLYAAVLLAFVLSRDTSTTGDVLFSSQYAVLALGATVVPLVSSLVLPRRAGAVLLAAWAVSLIAEWIGVMVDGVNGYHKDAGTFLMLVLVAGLALAWLLRGQPSPSRHHEAATTKAS